jgi:hypothetical protein
LSGSLKCGKVGEYERQLRVVKEKEDPAKLTVSYAFDGREKKNGGSRVKSRNVEEG